MAEEQAITQEIFKEKPIPWLKQYLKARGIQISGKRKAELVELCWNSHQLKAPKILEVETVESTESLIKEQLKTSDEGFLANPLSKESGLTRWTQDLVIRCHLSLAFMLPPSSQERASKYIERTLLAHVFDIKYSTYRNCMTFFDLIACSSRGVSESRKTCSDSLYRAEAVEYPPAWLQ